jgi:hypothetical protein
MDLGGTWHESEVLREEVVGLPARHAFGIDAVARRDRHSQVSTSSSGASKSRTDNRISYLKHDIEQPAFFVGMSLPPL